MEKYIEEIIEIILDNVSCDHPQADEDGRYSTGGRVRNIDYSLDNEKEVMKKCLAAIPAFPMKFIIKVGEEWIEDKARALGYRAESLYGSHTYTLSSFKEFIRSFINELSDKINLKGD